MRQRAGFWVLLSLVALLCFLGYLQYRWIDQLAQAEQERELQALRRAATRIASAFDVEVTRAQLAFGPFPFQMEAGAYWMERAQMWHEFAPYPRVVKDIYLTGASQSFKVTAGGLLETDGRIPSGTDPVAHAPLGRPDNPEGMRTIVFDGEYIREELLPQLASRYLNLERYGVRIASGGDVIFEHGEFHPELSTRLFSFRPECFGGGPRGDRRRRGGPPRRDAGPGLIARSDVTCSDMPSDRDEGRWILTAGLTPSGTSGLLQFRTRSLLLSFGVLAVLGTGIGMLGLYAHRAQILAQRQMEFAMAVSHELRTPLTVIRVAADNLSEGMVSEPKKYGDLIRRETVRLSDMVEQVLVFARTQRADIEPRFESVAPSEIIDRALSAVGPTLESAGLKVECDVSDDLPQIRADVNLVSAGLQNLLINAAKYAGKGGVVRVRAGHDDPSNVSIVVEDEGPGVRQSELDRIFAPFFRGSDAANSRVPGLGLGLHLVKRIAEAHGGIVRAQNRDGHGFLVEMRIPAVES
jgi:signal transduction histidine kinase